MIGLFVCWIAGSYWKKIYYIYITLMELLLLLMVGVGATMGEEGDYDPVSGNEILAMVLLLMLMIFILSLYVRNKRIADAFNTFIIMGLSLMFFDLMNSVSNILIIFNVLFMVIAALASGLVYCLESCYSAVLPSSYFGSFSAMFWAGITESIEIEGWKGALLYWGIGITLTAAGCLIQLQILKKTEMGTKKRNKLSKALK